MRTLALSTLFCGILCTPLFVFAQETGMTPEIEAQIAAGVQAAQQAAASSTAMQDALNLRKEADKAAQDARDFQTNLNNFVEERTNQILQPEEIEKKALGDYLDVKINPNNPAPNETVTITVESYLSDLQKAILGWSLNGKLISRGIAQTVFRFQNGSSGTTTRVSVTITTNTGVTITKDFSFTPIGVTILWEADTYTPPFYKGKSLMVPQARVRVVAVPDTSKIATSNLVYTWKQDGTVDTANSGYGKNSYSFIGPIPLSNKDIRVSVSSMDDSMNSEMRVSLPLVRPFILFYEKNPLLGVLYNKPLGTDFNLDKKEFSISAEPYFFSNEDPRTPTLKYSWEVNGKTVQKHSRTITIRNDTGAKGGSVVSLSMRGIGQTFQKASRDLTVHSSGEGSSERPTF